jgi:hypothetical protein
MNKKKKNSKLQPDAKIDLHRPFSNPPPPSSHWDLSRMQIRPPVSSHCSRMKTRPLVAWMPSVSQYFSFYPLLLSCNISSPQPHSPFSGLTPLLCCMVTGHLLDAASLFHSFRQLFPGKPPGFPKKARCSVRLPALLSLHVSGVLSFLSDYFGPNLVIANSMPHVYKAVALLFWSVEPYSVPWETETLDKSLFNYFINS